MRAALLAALFFCCCEARAAPEAPLRLTTVLVPGTVLYLRTEAVLRRAFARLGVAYTLESMPGERGTRMLANGGSDGEVGRAFIYGEVIPGIVRVAPPLFALDFVAIGAAAAPPLHSWSDLPRQHIAYRRGIKLVELHAGVTAEVVDTATACLLMMKGGRVDYCVGPRQDTDPEMGVLAGMKVSISAIATEPAYIFLRPERRALAASLGEVLRAMQKSGELAASPRADR